MRQAKVAGLLASVLLLVLAAMPAHAQGGTLITKLRGFNEVPALSTVGIGTFEATLNDAGTEIAYTLTFSGLRGSVTQSHLHIAQPGVNGAIMIFLCTNLGNGPTGTQPCPTGGGTITGTIHASDVTAGAANQGIGAGNFAAVLRAIRGGVVYANVHSDVFPGGEIRGQVKFTPAAP